MSETPRIAIVVDALPAYRGAERVVGSVLEMYPEAEIHTLIYEPRNFAGTPFESRVVHPSLIQKVPGAKRGYRSLLPLLPLAIERLDLSGADIVLSFSYAVAHGARCGPDQLHISYTFAPMRYAWQEAGGHFQSGPMALAARLIMHSFRKWDRAAAGRINQILAISAWTARCVEQAYGRQAQVIYPPIDTERFKPRSNRGEQFVAFSRLVRHKRVDLIVQAFNQLGLPLLVVGDGPERKDLEARAAPNVKFTGSIGDDEAMRLVGEARALVHAAREDFGLVMAEAQSAGTPVIAYGGGAAPEIVVDGKTGALFGEQEVESVAAGVRCFLEDEGQYETAACRANAMRFDRRQFQRAFGETVERCWKEFRSRSAVPFQA